MSIHQRRSRLKNIENTGFGVNSSVEGGRLTNKDGSTNLEKSGIPFWDRISIYHTLLRMKRSKFGFVVLFSYTAINIFFASIYFTIGVNHLMGTDTESSYFNKFMDAFFFSSQTLTTVGYGHIAPSGMAMNITASIESLLGILIFAVVTGLMYGRFARPRAYLMFSQNILIAPYKEGRAIMLRMATFKNNHLTDAEAQVTAAMHVNENGRMITRFYQLPLEISKINSLGINWTLVHALNENSPMYQFSYQELVDSKIELIVSVKAFDDHFSNIVQQRTSYTIDELVYGARFLPMFQRSASGSHTLLELDKINSYEMVNLPETNTDSLQEESVLANA